MLRALPPLYQPVPGTPEVIEIFRNMHPDHKSLFGGELFDQWVRQCEDLLRAWHPDATERDIAGMIGRHLDQERQREDIPFE